MQDFFGTDVPRLSGGGDPFNVRPQLASTYPRKLNRAKIPAAAKAAQRVQYRLPGR